MNYRTRKKRKPRIVGSLMGFVRTITAPTQIAPEVQNVIEKVDKCFEHCTRKIEQLAPKQASE